jgi:alpha-D-ribose 1-methylphosphonate 5-triphosphate synthase subunit PhnH
MIKEKHYDPVFHSQAIFRSALDAIARPGNLSSLDTLPIDPPAGLTRGLASLAFTLINRDVSYCLVGFNPETEAYLNANTSSRTQALHQADFLLCDGYPSAEVVQCAKTGILTYPETSSSIYAQVSGIHAEPTPDALAVRFEGPGIPESVTRWFTQAPRSFFEALASVNSEFPLGIDVLLVHANPCDPGTFRVLGIPRTARITILS